MSEILYPDYRNFVNKRIEANNAVMALLAGSQLAMHTLQLTEGSTATLKNVFPAVNHIKRFDLRTSDARVLLSNVEFHLASIAVPYALATHEAYVTGLVNDLKSWGYAVNSSGLNASNMHERVFDALNESRPDHLLQIFHVLRLARNGIIHRQGKASDQLISAIDGMDNHSINLWKRRNLNNTPRDIIKQDGTLNLTAETIFTAFASSKELGRSLNNCLQRKLDPQIWARIAILDYKSNTNRIINSSHWNRGLRGHVNQYYKNLGISEEILREEIRAMGN